MAAFRVRSTHAHSYVVSIDSARINEFSHGLFEGAPSESDRSKLLSAHLSWPTGELANLPVVVRASLSGDEAELPL
jgi:hypothetical protein